jgi:hypothetical protein
MRGTSRDDKARVSFAIKLSLISICIYWTVGIKSIKLVDFRTM